MIVTNNPAIHPTAIIAPNAKIGADVEIGPYCIIGDQVKLGDRVKCHSHVVIDGDTVIGDGSEIWPFASIGTSPQDLKFKGEASRLEIGKNNRIREYVTMNPGTQGGGLLTKVGDNCLFMMSTHVAHDCIVGNGVIMANNATLAGHVTVGDYAVIGGLAAIHQFARIGAHAMIGGMSGVEGDVIPYGLVRGERASLYGLNLVGLKRRGFSASTIQALQKSYKRLFAKDDTIAARLEALQSDPDLAADPLVMELIGFIKGGEANRGLVQPQS